MRDKLLLTLVLILVTAPLAHGNVVVTLVASADNPQALDSPVAAGTELSVDVMLSATADQSPISDVIFVQFDLRGIDQTALEVISFRWTLSDFLTSASFYLLLDSGGGESGPQIPTATFSGLEPTPGFIIELTTDAVRVATLTVRADASGTLDVLNSSVMVTDLQAQTEGGGVLVGFADPVTQSLARNNLEGGSVAITVAGEGGGPGPDENANTGGTDQNGNTQPPQNANQNGGMPRSPGGRRSGGACGLGMIGALLASLFTLMTTRRHRRPRHL